MKPFWHLFLLLAVCFGCGLGAPAVEAQSLEKRLEAELFSPDHLKRHRQTLQLEEAQVMSISKAIGTTEGKVTELQWRLDGASQDLVEAVAENRPDESTVMAKAKEVLRLENEIKMQHLKLLILIKNTLTLEQQDQLRDLLR